MLPELSDRDESLRMLRDSAAAFAARESPLARARALRGKAPDYDCAFWAKLAAQGWIGLLAPESSGGSGLGLSEMAAVAGVLATHAAPEPLVPTAVFAGRVLERCEDSVLAGRLLGELAAGKLVSGVAWQNAKGDIDPATTTVRAEESNGTVRLNGEARFVRPGTGCDGYIVSASGSGGLELYWLERAAAGVAVVAEPLADGTTSGWLRLKDAEAARDSRLAAGEQAGAILARAMDEALLMSAAELLAIADRMLEMTLQYLRTRSQFGQPIGSFQALQHRAVDLLIQKELAGAVVSQALVVFDSAAAPSEGAAHASRAKARAAEAALFIAREAVQMHGAIGFTDEYDLGLYFNRVLVLAAWLGNPAAHRRRYLLLEPGRAEADVTEAPRAAIEKSPGKSGGWNAMDSDAFRAEVRAFFKADYPAALRYPKARLRWAEIRNWYQTLYRKGWAAPAWPVEHGGMGLGPEKLVIFIEEQERWGVGRAPDQGILMVGPLLMGHGTDTQRAAYLPRILSGEHIWCQGYSEPNAGSDLASLRTEAIDQGDHFVVNGQKIWTTLAQDATHMFLLARTDKKAKKQEGISFLLMDFKSPGITVRPIRNLAGHEEFCEVFLDNVRVPKANLVGAMNRGWSIAKALLGFERLFIGSPKQAQYALARLEELAELAGVAAEPAYRENLARLRCDVADLAALYARFVEQVKRGEALGPEVSMLKIWASETFSRIANQIVETAGACGAMPGDAALGGGRFDVLTSYYNARPAAIYGGSNEIQRNILAREVLGLPSGFRSTPKESRP